jgi:hypothetical protein
MALNGYLRSVASGGLVASIMAVLLLWIHARDMRAYTTAGYPAIVAVGGIRVAVDSLRAEMLISRQADARFSASLDSLASEVEQLKREVK